MDAPRIGAIADSWVEAWNQRDLEAVLSHNAEDVEFQSPLVVKLLGDPSGTVRGKQKLREYLKEVFTAYPGDLQIALLGAYQGVQSRLVHFEARGRRAMEFMELDKDGKVRRAITLSQPQAIE